jgi:hypothetical protein
MLIKKRWYCSTYNLFEEEELETSSLKHTANIKATTEDSSRKLKKRDFQKP